MADPFTYKAAASKFACGADFTNLTVVNCKGPGGARLTAYSCNMNIDLDGETQAYGPFGNPKLSPQEKLGNAGWKSTGENAALKAQFEAVKVETAELEKKREELLKAKTTAAATAARPGAAPAPVPVPAPTPAGAKPPVAAKPAVDPAVATLDKQIAEKKKHLRAMSFENIDANGNYSAKNPKNFGQIFWKWYGIASLSPAEAKRESFLELEAPRLTIRRPVLDTRDIYEDVFGRFPVVQSVFEPGTGYFVGALPGTGNPRYPSWDQRHIMPNNAWAQTPFGALGTPLAAVTGLDLLDSVFAMRLDTADTLTFPFRDRGFEPKVAECSFAAFGGLGGEYHPEKKGAAQFPNDFLVLYLAFPGRQNPASVLGKFATASNAADFPVLLAFIAQATVDAQAKKSKVVAGDPIRAFEAWKKRPAAPKPDAYDTINQSLSEAGNNFVERMMRTHAANSQGPYLRPPTMP